MRDPLPIQPSYALPDYYASMLLNTLQDRGRKIPDEISITGFDDVEYASLVRPALTTVRQDIRKKARWQLICL